MIKKFLLLSVILNQGLLTSLLAQEKPVQRAIPGEYIVQLKSGALASNFFSNTKVKQIIKQSKMIKIQDGNIYRFRVHSNVQSSLVKKLSTHPMVEFVEPNYLWEKPLTKQSSSRSLNDLPQDDMFEKLWGLNNKNDTDINAPEAWSISEGSKKVIVAIVDSGIDLNHPDLQDNLWVNQAELNGKSGVDDDNNGFVDDIHGYDFSENNNNPQGDHGTHVAGTIGAVHNSMGVAGVAKNVSLMNAKIFGKEGASTAAIIEAIVYAVNNGAHVLNNSWGGFFPSSAIKKAIEYTHKKGAIFVVAAGNNSINNDWPIFKSFPASYKIPNIISVAATDIKGEIATYSNYGKKSVHVVAPGSDILSTVSQGKYATFSGTSMATPHVSGILAVMLSANTKLIHPKGSTKLITDSSKVKEILIRSSNKSKKLSEFSESSGRVDMYKAVKEIQSL